MSASIISTWPPLAAYIITSVPMQLTCLIEGRSINVISFFSMLTLPDIARRWKQLVPNLLGILQPMRPLLRNQLTTSTFLDRRAKEDGVWPLFEGCNPLQPASRRFLTTV